MKSIILILTMICASMSSYAQAWYQDSGTPLESKDKTELAKVYITELETLITNSTFMVVSETDIPYNKRNTRMLNNVIRSTEWHIDEVRYNLKDILPYMDREELIRAITFVKQINVQISSFPN